MTDLPSWPPPGVDTQRADAAWAYDYLLGGSHNVLADQDAGRAIHRLQPAGRAAAGLLRRFPSGRPGGLWTSCCGGPAHRLAGPGIPAGPATWPAWPAGTDVPRVPASAGPV